MATRRGRTRPADPEPESPPEPTPEPEPEIIEPEKPVEKLSYKEGDTEISVPVDVPQKSNCTERIIERIIICPGGQTQYPPCVNPYRTHGQIPHHFHPPPPPAIGVYPEIANDKPKKKRKKAHGKKDGDLAQISFNCKDERPIYPRPRPMADQIPNYQAPPVVIYHQPVHCCCKGACSDDSDDESGEEDGLLVDTTTFISFANMVFAAANVMSDFPDAY